MILLLDTNIAIDHLEGRKPFASAAKELLLVAVKNEHKLLITANSIDNIFYILHRKFPAKQVLKGLNQFLEIVSIATVNSDIIHKSIRSGWKDFEDAIQYFSALEAKADLIVTRDEAGYQERKVHVVSPNEALRLL